MRFKGMRSLVNIIACACINVKMVFLVSWNGDSLQWTRVQEQLVQNLLVHLLRHSATPERAELLFIHI